MRDELGGDFNLGINDTVGIAQDCGAKFTSNENRNQSKKKVKENIIEKFRFRVLFQSVRMGVKGYSHGAIATAIYF